MLTGTQSTAYIDFRVTRREMEAFCDLSGDTNPLHHDPAYAQRCGFVDRVVYGGLLVAQVSRLLGTRLPGHGCIWRSISMRFRFPLYVDEPARLYGTVTHANEELGLLDLKLRVEAGGRTIADGEAAASLAREGSHVE